MARSVAWVRVRGDRAYVSGHGPLNPDGSLCGPSGKVEAGMHARTASGVAALPPDHAGFIAAEVEATA